MNKTSFYYFKKTSVICLVTFVTLFLSTCTKGLQKKTIIYQNDFELNDLNGISTGAISIYNNSQVLGRYNNGGFILKLDNLEDHELIEVSFDLYIHDTWDGNYDPDIWQMRLDGVTLINTTFSNDYCSTGYCLPQSYPNNYLNSNHTGGTGAYATNLPAACSGQFKKSSAYKIIKTVQSSGKTFTLECMDKLKNIASDQICDESWSVDNIKISAVKLN